MCQRTCSILLNHLKTYKICLMDHFYKCFSAYEESVISAVVWHQKHNLVKIVFYTLADFFGVITLNLLKIVC